MTVGRAPGLGLVDKDEAIRLDAARRRFAFAIHTSGFYGLA